VVGKINIECTMSWRQFKTDKMPYVRVVKEDFDDVR
jgi:hypothetical protein